MPNDRSTERLLQRKRIAEEAGKVHPGEWGTDIRYNLKMTAVCADNGEPMCIMTDDEDVATATHIALSDPGITQQDIEEIIKMRAENERLRGEVESLNKQADWLVKMLSHYTEDCPLKFKLVYEERFPIPKIDNCHGQEGDIEDCAYFSKECWREANLRQEFMAMLRELDARRGDLFSYAVSDLGRNADTMFSPQCLLDSLFQSRTEAEQRFRQALDDASLHLRLSLNMAVALGR